MSISADDLSLEEQASLTSGQSTWNSQGLDGKVESIVLSDGPHGLRRQPIGGDNLGIGGSVPATCFPPAVGLASTWNRELIHEVAAALGREAKALGVSVLLGPGLNIKRSPLGGRNFEYASEDPYLSGQFGEAFVKGVQSEGVAATPKHFAVNNQETDRFRIDARVDERTLREIYLPAFENVVKQAQPWALMCSYNKVNGTYASHNPWLLTSVLRDEWGYDGLVVSDWGAVVDRAAAVAAGLDLEMPPTHTDERVVAAVEAGTLDAAAVKLSAQRLLDLLERTTPARATEPTMAVDAVAGETLARKAAAQAAVLLRNDGVLPLDPARQKTLALVGAFAAQPRFQGGGSSRVVPTSISTVLDELTERGGFESLSYAPGFDFGPAVAGAGDAARVAHDAELRRAAVEQVAAADVAVVMVGLPDGAESEGADRTTMNLPQNQVELLQAVLATGTPVVVVISGGSVVELGDWHEKTSALVEGWLLGQAGGAATVDLLLGKAEPSGRLAESIPLTLSDNPSHLNFPGSDEQVIYGEGLFVGYRYYDSLGRAVAYPFGHGLTYTDFEFTDPQVSVQADGSAVVEVSVKNTGSRRGTALAQFYVGTPDPSAPVHALQGFERVGLEPGEQTRLSVTLQARAFARWDIRDHAWRVPAGQYTVEIGSSSRDIHHTLVVEQPGDGFVSTLVPMSTVSEWLAHPTGAAVIAPLVESVRSFGGADAAPEIEAMFLQMPLTKLTAFGFGFTEEKLQAILEAANTRP